MLTYAQNFEDVMLDRLFQGERQGFYLDVGAWDPTEYSVTRHFYDAGWRGINIEPNPRQFALFERDRADEINLRIAIGARDAALARFFDCMSDTSLSTTDPLQADRLRSQGLAVEEYEVPVRSLQSVIDQYCPDRTIDFLKVDVEGAEREVLAGLDLCRSRPRVMVIEATRPATRIVDWDDIGHIANWQEWEPAILEAGYHLAHYDGLSRFYLREDISGRRGRLLLPPGVHDLIQTPVEAKLRQEIEVVNEDRQRRVEIIGRLTRELEEANADRQARLVLIEELSRRIDEIEADRAARLDLINTLTRELEVVNEDRAKRLALIEDLNRQLKLRSGR